MLFEFEKAAPTIHLEHFRGPTFLYDKGAVEDYRSELETLMGAALSTVDSFELLETIIKQLENDQE